MNEMNGMNEMNASNNAATEYSEEGQQDEVVIMRVEGGFIVEANGEQKQFKAVEEVCNFVESFYGGGEGENLEGLFKSGMQSTRNGRGYA